MSDFLQDRLGVTPQEKAKSAKTTGKIKSVATYLADAVKAVKDSTLVEAISEAAPWWLTAGGKAVAESAPVLKFAVDFFSELTKEHDPHVLGLFACTLAYQRSVEEVFRYHCSDATVKRVGEEVAKEIEALEFDGKVEFKSFSFQGALADPFYKQATKQFEAFATITGYKEDYVRILTGRIDRAFVRNLKTILSHGKLRDKFRPFADLMTLGNDGAGYDTLLSHVEYTRWKFEEERIFGKEPFALGHVYINTECGKLTWGDTRQDHKKSTADAKEVPDPFKEKFGGRHDLLQQVFDLMADENLQQPIVIQGVAGSGKSSFTLKLATELGRRGFVPLRVRLKDLRLDVHVREALPEALFPKDQKLPPYVKAAEVKADFFKNVVRSETVDWQGTEISRYVLILDGWDEISISSSEGFRMRVTRMLEQVLGEYLSMQGTTVRVILTGRPSVDVEQSNVLLNETPLLTVRAIQPDQLVGFVKALRDVTSEMPLRDPGEKDSPWKVPAENVFQPILDQYRNEYDAERGNDVKTSPKASSMEVLGLPLLAHLAVRLISQWPGKSEELVGNPTTLYRSMIDLTCGNSGKSSDEKSGGKNMHRVSGERLRELLHRTAAAMTAYGSESISYQELSYRLGKSGDQLQRETSKLVTEHELSALMIAYFFKGGQTDLGCEFLHKSFREYLFAEGIVEALKGFGRQEHGELPVREIYWQDFEKDDPRRKFSEELSYLLAPQWLSHEVVKHLENLLPWEIGRTNRPELWKGKAPKHALVLESISPGQWEEVRDVLADLWDWWAEGVPLRPQPERNFGAVSFTAPLTNTLSRLSLPFDQNSPKELIPPRTATMDAHLGDGLFRLACIVHFQAAVQKGWLDDVDVLGWDVRPAMLWDGITAIGEGPRRCQSKVTGSQGEFVFFAPGGAEPQFFKNYMSRVDAAAWRPAGPFPHGVDMSGVDFRGAYIAPAMDDRERAIKVHRTRWSFANLSGANGIAGDFVDHEFHFALAAGSNFNGAVIVDARFVMADLTGALFMVAYLEYTNFRGAIVDGSIFDRSNLEGAVFTDAKGTPFEFAPIGRAEGMPDHWPKDYFQLLPPPEETVPKK